MPNPSPTCVVSDAGGGNVATTNGVNVGAGDSIVISLASSAGVNTWTCAIVGQDELVSPPTLVINSVAKTCAFTAPAAGSALIFQSQVNSGRDVNGVLQPSYTTTFGIYTLQNGNRVFASNERAEGSASFGWISKVNPLLRAGSGGGSAAYATQRATGASAAITVPASGTPQWAAFYGLSGTATCTLPASPTSGQVVKVADVDGSLATQNITIAGNGHNIVAFAAGVASYTVTKTQWPAYSVLELVYDNLNSFWKVS